MKNTHIEDLTIGQTFCDQFQVVSTEERKTVTGQPFMLITLRDRTGELKGNKWKATASDFTTCAQGCIIVAEGVVEEYPKDKANPGKGPRQLNISRVSVASAADTDASDFIPVAAKSYDELMQDMRNLVDLITDPWLNALVKTVLRSKDGQDWMRWPAAKSVHHAVKHGLLQHSVEVAEYADAICCVRGNHSYPEEINRSLVIAGALLHDIGKVKEYVETQNAAFDIGVGGLHGHIVIGVQMITKAVFDSGIGFCELYDELIHILCSHHQELEHGSPVKPMTPEALIVAKADQLSSDLYSIWDARHKYTGQGVYAKTMHGYVYCPKG